MDKKYKEFDPILQEVSRKLTIFKNSKKDHVDAFLQVFNEFRKKLQDMDPFLTTYKKIKFTGSYANNIKIVALNEFDMMLCMKLPKELGVTFLNSNYPGYIQLKTSGLDALKKKQNWEKYKSMEIWIDEKNFILQNKYREWLESIINKILNQLIAPGSSDPVLICGSNKYRLNLKKSNPAFTLKVEKLSNEGIKFDLDLVPSFVFEYPAWPPMVKDKYALKCKGKEWLVIAKPIYCDVENRHKCWRIVFPEQEIELLSGHNNMKSTIRFMKQLRDFQKMPYIKSYFINTLFLLEADAKSPEFWNNRLSFLFMYMLGRLRERIEQRQIPYFWYNRLNLLQKLSDDHFTDCSIKITNILKVIEKNYPANPKIIAAVLGVEDGFIIPLPRSIGSTQGASTSAGVAEPAGNSTSIIPGESGIMTGIALVGAGLGALYALTLGNNRRE